MLPRTPLFALMLLPAPGMGATCTSQENGINYANLIHGMSLAGIELDRKSLAELAIREPEGFSEVVKLAQTALPA